MAYDPMEKLQRQFYAEQDRISEIAAASADVKNLEKQVAVDHLKVTTEINKSLKEQIAVAVSDSESAKKDAMFSKIAAIVSILISIIALLQNH
ncbi:hypothetical protein [Acetobacterium wieringae]|uniref:hypothetical protein n=1 Tax=Acetobacterium wieringae TaxID=52694 RepID=UPI002033E1E9|nr:hypothetical protein [Acetobacterium wieringae]URN85185.1 hypothetical protein CHL1_000816 [Acetobacterium wieringae]